jgi:hypothetical protein
MQHILSNGLQGLGNSGFAVVTPKTMVKSYFWIHVHSFRCKVCLSPPDIDAAPSATTMISPNIAVRLHEDIDH